MEAAQVGAGLDGQLLGEGRAGGLEGRQRLGGVARVALRPHQQHVSALAQGVPPDVLLEEGGRRARLAEHQPYLRQPLDHGGLILVDRVATGGHPGAVGEPGEHRAAAQVVRPLEVLGRAGEVAGGERGLRLGPPSGEAEQVQLIGGHVQAVAGAESHERAGTAAGGAEEPAQVAGVGAHVGDGRRGWLVGPEFVDEVVDRHRLAVVEREDAEDGLLFGCAEPQFEPVGPGLERPKNADLQHQSQTLARRDRPIVAALYRRRVGVNHGRRRISAFGPQR